MFLKQINQLRGNTAFRLSATIAAALLLCMFIFNLTIQPLIKEDILKKHSDIVEYKLDQFHHHYDTRGYDSLIQLLKDYEEEARLQGFLVRVIDKQNTVLSAAYPHKRVAEVFAGNVQAYMTEEGGWTRFYKPAPLLGRLKNLFSPRDQDFLIMFKAATLNDNLTIQIGYGSPRINRIESDISVLFRFVNLFFATTIFICSVVLIQLALRPLKDLLKTIHKISSGDMTARVAVRSNKNDIGQMANMFNHMLDKTEALVVRMKESLDNVAHDLRTPLSRIRLSIEQAVQNDNKEALKEALFDCAEEVEKLERFLKTMMDISEAEAETMNLYTEEVDLKGLISESKQQYDYLLEDKNLDLQLHLSEDLRIKADPDRIRQVLYNLIDNAIKYTPEGGNIRISTQDNHKSVLLSIKDTGIGIHSDDQKHIFERLYRADKSRSTKGLGLGLSLVKAVLQAHRSEIKVTSEPGKGTIFHLLLPKDFQQDATLDWNKALP